jgi:uncharacterized protein with FMN-binding domain
MAKKASRKLVALSSAAILAAYAAGYARTQPVADLIARGEGPGVSLLDPVQAASYHDGTYTATGRGPFGDVTVALTLRRHRIVSVRITACTTTYPPLWIAGLPAQVLARQSADVDVVSGATWSTAAFHDAVLQALAQARL